METEKIINVPEPYEVYEKIGAGGGGTVYKAYDKNLRKYVVIKKIHDTITDENRQRVEVDTLKNLHHQYLPQVFSYFQIDGVGYTVMDYVEGESLRNLLDRGVKFSQKKVIKYAQQLIEAVNYLHSQRIPIYHGDIKPDNIMLTTEDNICLIDFNVSGITNEGKAITFGITPGYGAPEQYASFRKIQQVMTAVKNTYGSSVKDQQRTEFLSNDETELLLTGENGRTAILSEGADDKTEILLSESPGAGTTTSQGGERTDHGVEKKKSGTEVEMSEGVVIDRQTDIYSIGATLYHLVSGVKPKMENNANIADLVPGISDGLAYLITKAMMYKPENRYKDCESMLKTIQQIDRMDRRYKRLNRLEYLTVFVLFLLLVGSGGLILKGRALMDQEKGDTYSGLINEMKGARISKDYDQLPDLLNQAIKLHKDYCSAYYEMALAYYEQREYEKCISFLKDKVYSGGAIDYGDMEDDCYFLSARSYFELGDYLTAADYYEKAVRINPNAEYYYRDYVIALARLNRISEAREVLEKAKEYGVTTDTMYLLEGEIGYIGEDYSLAEKSLKDCISSTSNAETLVRAYGKLDEVYEKMYSGEESYNVRIPVLKEGIDKVSQEDGIALMERLAQAYVDRADLNPEGAYEDNRNAIEILEEIRNLGYGSAQTDYNIAVLYERSGDYQKAIECTQRIIDTWGADYRWYKRLAFVELERQNAIENKERDYSKFREYYEAMNSLYEDSRSQSGDMEVQVLKQLYNDLIEQGWLE